MILLGDYEIRGKLMTKVSSDAFKCCAKIAPSLPVTSSRLSRVNSTDQPISSGVALVNSLKISFLHVERQAAASAI